MKKALSIILILAMALMSFGILAACDNNGGGDDAPPPAPANGGGDDVAANDGGDDALHIVILSKGFQHQFWQAVYQGAQEAAAHYGVETLFFDGPESEADIHVQVDMFNAQLAQNPDGIALAALDTSAVTSQLQDAYNSGIPVVGFDSGVPDAPAGQVLATASTNNINAAALGADHMFPVISDQISAATADSPALIVVLSQDATSESITGRTRGFAERMYTLASGANDSVAITGGYGAINTGDANAAVQIHVVVGATPGSVDMQTAATGALTMANLIGLFGSNEGAANAIIAAVNAGTAIPDGVPVVGFDAGTAQKDAVRAGVFMGAITQDPVQIGYQSVSLLVRAIRGESISDVDTGAQWWDADNMDNPGIAVLLYD